MKKFASYVGLFGAAAISLTGCLPSENASSSSLRMLLTDSSALAKPSYAISPSTTPLTFSDGATIFTITEARMHIRDVRFDTSNTDVVGEDYQITGPYVMNLLDGTALPSDIEFSAPAGEYKRVDIRLDEANPEDAPLAAGDALLGNALLIKGTHDYNGVTDGTFTLSVKVTEDIRFEPVNGIVVGTDAGADVTLVYKVTDWLEDPANPGTKIDLTSCITVDNLMDANNHIQMTEGTQCTGISQSIGNIVKDNMKNRYDMSSL